MADDNALLVSRNAAREIIRPLERVRNREGRWFMDVFRDFLEVADALPLLLEEAAPA